MQVASCVARVVQRIWSQQDRRSGKGTLLLGGVGKVCIRPLVPHNPVDQGIRKIDWEDRVGGLFLGRA